MISKTQVAQPNNPFQIQMLWTILVKKNSTLPDNVTALAVELMFVSELSGAEGREGNVQIKVYRDLDLDNYPTGAECRHVRDV